MNSSPTIIISGASGFIGSELANHFAKKKWKVIGLVVNIPEKPLVDVVYVKYDLHKTVDEGIFEGADYLIHCAYIKNNIETNIVGTKVLKEISEKYKLKKNIFLSSFAAMENAISRYGKQKIEIEKYFQTEKDCVIRAGVVLGNAGLFNQMSEHIRKGKRIPLIDGGKQPFQTIHIQDLILVIEKIINENLSGTFTVAEIDSVSYKDFFAAVCNKLGVKPKFISVPFPLLIFVISIAEILRIKIPIAKENVLGLKNLKERETKKDLEKLEVKIRNYRESLRDL